MSRGNCPRIERDGCPVAEQKFGCHSDIDHITPQRYKKLGLLVRKYIVTPDNKQRICRWEHLQKTDTETEELIPSEDVMLDAVRRAYEGGFINLSKRDQSRLFGATHAEMDTGMAVLSIEHPAEVLAHRMA